MTLGMKIALKNFLHYAAYLYALKMNEEQPVYLYIIYGKPK